MAGIGFVLRRLASQDNFSGIIRAYIQSAIIAVGPWIFIILSLSCITYLSSYYTGFFEINEFLAVMIYNFLFSFIFSAPIYMVSARYVSDSLYMREITPIPGILISSLFYLLIPAALFGTLFYLFFANMTPLTTVLSIINFILLAEIWVVTLYLGCLRDFRAITFSWLIGVIVGIYLAVKFGRSYETPGFLGGVNIGFIILIYSLKANILAEYPHLFRKAKEFQFYFHHYKGLFWGGLFLFSGMWIDKVIMWSSPEATVHLNNLRTFPLYDGGMFLAFLTIIPVMALFILSLETNFYDPYIQYVRHIEHNAPFALLQEGKNSMIKKIIENGRNFLVLQGTLTLIAIILAPDLLVMTELDFLQLSIFRLGALGAFFAALNLFIVVIFSYFDSQEEIFKLTGFMLLSNTILTLFTQWLGFRYYGLGFCISMILTFFIGSLLLIHFVKRLNFHIFVFNVVKRQNFTEPDLENELRILTEETEEY